MGGSETPPDNNEHDYAARYISEFDEDCVSNYDAIMTVKRAIRNLKGAVHTEIYYSILEARATNKQ